MGVQQNGVGIIFRATIKDQDGAAVDVSGSTTKEIVFKDEQGSTTVKAAAYTSDGSDGRIQYATEVDVLSRPGNWEWQAHIVKGSDDWYTAPATFVVDKNLV